MPTLPRPDDRLITFHATAAWRLWAVNLAESQDTSLADLIGRGLAMLAGSVGYPSPPRRRRGRQNAGQSNPGS